MTEKSDKELLREYGEQQKKKQADWLEATRKNYRVDRHSTPRKERTLWDPTSERLPTIEEIKDNRGWPSAENEAKLRALFFDTYRDEIASQLKDEASENATEQTLGVFYGVYLMNFISGGLICNKFFDFSSFQKWELYQWQKKTENLDPNSLQNWPVEIKVDKKRSQVSSNGVFGISICIEIGTQGYTSNTPYEKKHFTLGRKEVITKKFAGLQKKVSYEPEYQYHISEVEDAILTGIEEAHHSIYRHLQIVQEIPIGDRDLISNDRIEVFSSALARFSENDRLNYYLDYHAARLREYIAKKTQALYVKK